jgi:hypothetical protein
LSTRATDARAAFGAQLVKLSLNLTNLLLAECKFLLNLRIAQDHRALRAAHHPHPLLRAATLLLTGTTTSRTGLLTLLAFLHEQLFARASRLGSCLIGVFCRIRNQHHGNAVLCGKQRIRLNAWRPGSRNDQSGSGDASHSKNGQTCDEDSLVFHLLPHMPFRGLVQLILGVANENSVRISAF